MKYLFAFIFFVTAWSPLFAEVKYSVSTDKTVYEYGDSIQITIKAVNEGDVSDTLYLTFCDVNYFVDNYDLLGHRPCPLVIVPTVIPPHDSATWGPGYLPPFPVTDTLTEGEHAVVGEVAGYWISDTIQVQVVSKAAEMAREFYPLDSGDLWEYFNFNDFGAGIADTETVWVLRDSVVSGKSYKLVKDYRSFDTYASYSLEGYDSLGDDVRYFPQNDSSTIIYPALDSVGTRWRQSDILIGEVDSIYSAKIFGVNRQVISVRYYRVSDSLLTFPLGGDVLAQGIGLISGGDNEEGGLVLVGARINDTTYGTLTSLDKPKLHTPLSFQLYQNYPNPFNPTTVIGFSVPSSMLVSLKIYDVLGREVRTLVHKVEQPGSYVVEFDGSSLPSGVYFYRLQAGNFEKTRKLMILK